MDLFQRLKERRAPLKRCGAIRRRNNLQRVKGNREVKYCTWGAEVSIRILLEVRMQRTQERWPRNTRCSCFRSSNPSKLVRRRWILWLTSLIKFGFCGTRSKNFSKYIYWRISGQTFCFFKFPGKNQKWYFSLQSQCTLQKFSEQ